MGPMGNKRMAVLLCAEDSEYVKKMYGGYFEVYKAMLASPAEEWHSYRAYRGELPHDKEIELYDGFVISGSCSDAHGEDAWIRNLVALVKKLDFLEKKVLGICFGHQLLARAIGGETGRANSWDIGLRTIQSTSGLFSSLDLPSSLPVIEFHRDEVKKLPAGAEVIGRSDKTGIEMFRYGDHIMGIQGHPEYTRDILLHLIDRVLERNFISESYAEELRASVGECEPAREEWKRLCVTFLKGRL